jgi:AAA15 family ATPase/GTPase
VQQYFNSIFSNIKNSGFHSIEFNSSMIKKLSESRKQKLLRILRYADIGIDNIEFKQGEESDIEKMVEVLNQNEKIPEELKNMILDKIKSSPEDIGGIVFSHNIDGRVVAFDDDNQSTGTIQLLALLDKVFDALENGSVLIIDELELNLHPDLVVFILNLFNSPYENPKGGQLIFSFHNSIFMQNLKPEQLWLAQKNKQGHTELYAAAAFEDLGDLHTQDLEKLYRAGRFAAKPAISYISQTAL